MTSTSNNLQVKAISTRAIIAEIFDVTDVGVKTTEAKEDVFYNMYLDKIIDFCNGKVEGLFIKQLVAGAGVVAKQKQTRGAMRALRYQILRDGGKITPPATTECEAK